MAKMLVATGMDVRETAVIADDRDAILNTLTRCLKASDAVLITGGLGPTKDDVTKKVLCEFFGSKLVENQEALENVKRIFAARGYELTPINRQQAWVPECCTMINNILGTAPCMWFEREGKVVVSMPGVPFEMENLMTTEIIKRLQKHFATGRIINKNILVQGIGESFLSDLIEQWELALPKTIRLAYLPQAGMVKLRLTERISESQPSAINDQLPGLYALAGQYIVGEDCETLPELAHKLMTSRGCTLSTAESCTGGTIASRLTAFSGASAYFKGGIVAYSNEVKENILGVRSETLASYGAVSEETVHEMVEGVRQHLKTDYAIATTGIAGPTGGTPDKPVGTVWIAVAGPNGIETRLKKFGDDRLRTVDRTCNEAFSMLIKLLYKNINQ
jgi:nicotinamide-nucleotide amidase